MESSDELLQMSLELDSNSILLVESNKIHSLVSEKCMAPLPKG